MQTSSEERKYTPHVTVPNLEKQLTRNSDFLKTSLTLIDTFPLPIRPRPSIKLPVKLTCNKPEVTMTSLDFSDFDKSAKRVKSVLFETQ